MLRRYFLTLSFALTTIATASATPRAWTSVDGTRSVQGEYVSRSADSVTIRNTAGSEVVIPFPQLHADDRKWLDAEHPLTGASAPAHAVPDPAAVFDTLKFGDTRDEVLAKLKASKIVELTTDETFIGRSGLNGVFRTRQAIGTLYGFLYFDWTGSGRLREINLQTDPRPEEDYQTVLAPSWKEFVQLLSTIYGKPVQKGTFPSLSTLQDGTFAPSHLWTLDAGGSALLGSARDGGKYQLVVRFTEKQVKPVALP